MGFVGRWRERREPRTRIATPGSWASRPSTCAAIGSVTTCRRRSERRPRRPRLHYGAAASVWGSVGSSWRREFPMSTFPMTVRLDTAVIDSYPGGLATPLGPSVIRAPFEVGTAPTRGCPVDHSAEWLQGPAFPGEGGDSTRGEDLGGGPGDRQP